MESNTSNEIEIDLKGMFYALKSKIWIIILSAIVMSLVAGLISTFLIKPIYTSTTKLYVVSKATTITSLADLQLGTQLTRDYMVLVKSRPVIDEVIKNLDLDTTYEGMLAMLQITNPADTRILEIKISNPDPYLAKEIADEFAKASKSQIAIIMDVGEPTIVEEGFIESSPSSPNVSRNVALGRIIGVFLSGIIIILRYVLDDTIKSSDDIEKHLGLNILGLIPIESGALKQMEADKKEKRKNKKGKRYFPW